MNGVDKKWLLEAHRPRWPGTRTWLGFLAAFFLVQGLLAAVYTWGPGWLAALLVLVLAHLMHAHLIAFHEAAHGSLCPSRTWNDVIGVFLGSLSFMSLSLYRSAHHSHHTHLATERDEELWPFVLPSAPLWARRLAAFLELTLGLLYTPGLFLRTFLRKGSPVRGRALRRRVWAELGLSAGVSATLVAVTAWWGAWEYLVVLFLIPALLAADMQSLRKYIEHMGLAGATPLGATRSVVPRGRLGRLVAFSLFNEPYHGVHHTYARLPQERLPACAAALSPAAPREVPPLPSYWRALGPVLRGLRDPRIGPQWLRPAPARGRRW